MTDLHDKARALLALRKKWPVSFEDEHLNNHEVADIIAELLAENERLTEEVRQCEAYMPLLTERMMDAEAALANERVHVIELTDRAESAEARFQALCEAEPVAVVDTHGIGRILWLALVPDGVRLIPRPSMEVKP